MIHKKSVNDVISNGKGRGKIVMITAYDMASASAVAEAGADIILVGDSLGVTVLGCSNTHCVTLDIMEHHMRAVRAGAPDSFIVCDMPKGTYSNADDALRNGMALVSAGADAVKVEGVVVESVSALVKSGIPVMGHVGLTPQSFDVYKVQGRKKEDADKIVSDAVSLQNAGVFSIVVELVPSVLGKEITEKINVPCIGIGAGADCDGQVLVFNDLLGIFDRFQPKFVRRYRNIKREMVEGCREFVNDVRAFSYPSSDELYQ